jgi:Flp pilus assembly protein TadG
VNPRKRNPKRSGAAVIEFAVIIPVFMLILLGTIEACTMIFLQQSLETAAYEGARVTIVPKTKTSDVEAAANVILTPRKIQNSTITITPADFQSAPFGTFIRVTVSAPCNSNSVLPPMFYGSGSLTANVDMMKEF